MEEWFDIESDKQQVNREKQKARALRKTNWWQAQIAAGKCHYCQQSFAATELTMDHVVPLSRGGKSTKSNIVPCCKKCNSEKKYYTPVEMVMDLLEQESKTDEQGPGDNE